MVIKKAMNIIKKMLRNWLLNKLSCSIDQKEIIIVRENNGQVQVSLGQEKLSSTELRNLKSEADSLQRMRIWRIMQETVKQKAIEKAILQSTDFEQVLSGKLMLHNLGIQQSIIDLIQKLKDPESGKIIT